METIIEVTPSAFRTILEKFSGVKWELAADLLPDRQEGDMRRRFKYSDITFVEKLEEKNLSNNELRIQGVHLVQAKMVQSMERVKEYFDEDDWHLLSNAMQGMIEGMDIVVDEINNDKIPEKFKHIIAD